MSDDTTTKAPGSPPGAAVHVHVPSKTVQHVEALLLGAHGSLLYLDGTALAPADRRLPTLADVRRAIGLALTMILPLAAAARQGDVEAARGLSEAAAVKATVKAAGGRTEEPDDVEPCDDPGCQLCLAWPDAARG